MCALASYFGRDSLFDNEGSAGKGALERIGDAVRGVRARRREIADRSIRALSGAALRDIGLGRVYDVTFNVHE